MQPTMTHIALHVRDLDTSVDFYRTYCGMRICHRREHGDGRVVWLAEPEREHQFVFVLISGGPGRLQAPNDFSHFGFALSSEAEVDRLAERARAAGRLIWEPRREPFPVGYYCGVIDPDGNVVEFSYGQPLGAGAAAL